jgi:hypothetical protein
MALSMNHIASALSVSPQELERRSLLAYIEKERRLAILDIEDLQDRYGVHSVQTLVKRIEQGQIYAHPAWEDSIEWEQIESYLNRLTTWAGELEKTHV